MLAQRTLDALRTRWRALPCSRTAARLRRRRAARPTGQRRQTQRQSEAWKPSGKVKHGHGLVVQDSGPVRLPILALDAEEPLEEPGSACLYRAAHSAMEHVGPPDGLQAPVEQQLHDPLVVVEHRDPEGVDCPGGFRRGPGDGYGYAGGQKSLHDIRSSLTRGFVQRRLVGSIGHVRLKRAKER